MWPKCIIHSVEGKTVADPENLTYAPEPNFACAPQTPRPLETRSTLQHSDVSTGKEMAGKNVWPKCIIHSVEGKTVADPENLTYAPEPNFACAPE